MHYISTQDVMLMMTIEVKSYECKFCKTIIIIHTTLVIKTQQIKSKKFNKFKLNSNTKKSIQLNSNQLKCIDIKHSYTNITPLLLYIICHTSYIIQYIIRNKVT